jgi:uncharacterized protein (TIGR04255 family)
MEIVRKCQKKILSKQPLALVLIQIRFTPIMEISRYVPEIQSALRNLNFPTYNIEDSLEITLNQAGIRPLQKQQWLFKSLDEYENIALDSQQITYQSANYDVFENFYEKFDKICDAILKVIQNFSTSVFLQRYGLRYVDRINPQEFGESNATVDTYISPDFNIQKAKIFGNQQKVCKIIQAGEVNILDGKKGPLAFRLTQGESGLTLPPDLMRKSPKLKKQFNAKDNIGFIDIDHSYQPANVEKYEKIELKRMFYAMHDNVHNLFYSIISKEGVELWK